MRVFLFGLFLLSTYLMKQWTGFVPLVLPCLLSSCFTLDFWFYYYYYIISMYILSYHLYCIPPVSCSYHIIPCMFPAWYQLLSLYLLQYACAHDTVFNTCLWFRFIDTRVLVPAHYLAFTTPLIVEFWLFWILMSRSRRLELLNSPGCWSEMRNESVYH